VRLRLRPVRSGKSEQPELAARSHADRRCRGIVDVKPPTEAHRRYWPDGFTLDEIREMGAAMWG
jgi:hypothetical protein